MLGGSFDPPHRGHVHITHEAMKRFELDEVWWLISPGNPLKEHGPAAFARRMAAARDLVDHPRVRISDFELRIGSRYTAETLRNMAQRYPQARFVWLMGADNLAELHRWRDWHQIMERVPVGVLARPGHRHGARTSKAARIYRSCRLRGRQAALLGQRRAPAWCLINVPMVDHSSSVIRGQGHWA